MTALINELAAQSGENAIVLVLDDYHLINAQQVHASLAFLLEHLPPGLHRCSQRSDPPLPLARLRARGQLTELRTDDLRFTAEEGAALLRESAGAALPGAAVAALVGRTEGWAAGLAGRPVAAGTVRRRRVRGGLQRQPPLHPGLSDRRSARRPARAGARVFAGNLGAGTPSGGLCDAVTGRDNGQAMLEHVEQAGLFLMPLDEIRGWWRYHHLFADLLRARCGSTARPGHGAAPGRRRLV